MPARPLPARSRAARLALHAALVALTLAPGAAQAQFGKLKGLGSAVARGAVEKVVEKKAGDAVAERTGSAAAAAAPGAAAAAGAAPTAEARPTTVRFTESVLEITEARLGQLLRGMEAEAAARPVAERRYQAKVVAAREADRTFDARRAAFERERAAWQARHDALESCHQAVDDRWKPRMDAEQAQGQRTANSMESQMTPERRARLQAMQQRVQAAQARGDQATAAAISDSARREIQAILATAGASNEAAQRLVANSEAIMAEKKKCGDLPPEPKAPASAGFPDGESARREVREAGLRASGLTDRQFAVLCERVETYVKLAGRTGATRYIFAASELGVLAARREALQGRVTLCEIGEWSPDEPAGA